MENVTKKMFAWNLIGGICNSATSFIILIFVTRICTTWEAGVFSLAFATAQMMLSIGRYGMRAYQVTDIDDKVSFRGYVVSRVITCMLMVAATLLYIVVSEYTKEKGIIFILVCFIKMTDAIEDVLHGYMQKNGRLDAAGKLLFVRNLFTIAAFCILIVVTENLRQTCMLCAVLSISFCLIINIGFLTTMRISWGTKKLGTELIILAKDCFPLFIGTFLSIYIYNAPKYMIDFFLTEEIQTCYNIIFMPAFVINMLCEFIFKPLLGVIASYWKAGEYKKLTALLIKLQTVIVAVTLVVVIAGAFLGIPVLEFIYGVDLAAYRAELIGLLIGGGFGASVYMFYNVLTTFRKRTVIFQGYLFASILITCISGILTVRLGVMGSALSYLITQILLAIFFWIAAARSVAGHR